MSNAINKAWELFFEGKIAEAKQLVEEAYQVDTCLEYGVLNLFVYLYLEEKSYEEIAEITGLTVTNVATKISRIKDKLRKMNKEE